MQQIENYARVRIWLEVSPLNKKGEFLEKRELSYKGNIPTPGPLFYLFKFLLELGNFSYSGGEMIPILWSELKAWIDFTGIIFTYQEIKIIRILSEIYVDQYNKSIKENCVIPWNDPDLIIDIEDECKRHKSFLRNFT